MICFANCVLPLLLDFIAHVSREFALRTDRCYYNAGLDYCEEQEQNNNNQNGFEFRLEEAVECRDVDVDEDALAYY